MVNTSILRDVGLLINKALGLEKEETYEHMRICLALSQQTHQSFDAKELIQDILNLVTCNWHGGRSTGNENWRWKKQTEIDPNNESAEVCLERLIVTNTGDDWVNQVPMVSGLTRGGDKRRAVDLVHRSSNRCYELIELKIHQNAGTPLFAAMEILQYGILYIFSRYRSRELGYPVEETGLMGAKLIELRVLAPGNYYNRTSLNWLQGKINDGLQRFLRGGQFEMNFEFQQFPEHSLISDPCTFLKDRPQSLSVIEQILRGRRSAYLCRN